VVNDTDPSARCHGEIARAVDYQVRIKRRFTALPTPPGIRSRMEAMVERGGWWRVPPGGSITRSFRPPPSSNGGTAKRRGTSSNPGEALAGRAARWKGRGFSALPALPTVLGPTWLSVALGGL
jgi:hypothetical protein